MAAGGVYEEGAATQRGAASIGLPLIQLAIDGAEIAPDGDLLLLADFGAADGSNSLAPMGAALGAIRERAPRRPVVVMHADILGNDFSALASTLTTSPLRYTLGDTEVVPAMVSGSLFGRVVPENSLVFGWTASTLHWLTSVPGAVADHFFVQLSTDDDAKRAYAAQSASDWVGFLAARSAELIPGTSVVIVDVLMGDDALMGSEALFNVLNGALRKCTDNGVLDAVELSNIVYPTWFRSLSEFQEPFAPMYVGPSDGVLELLDIAPAQLPDPFANLLDDKAAYAAAQVDFLRGFLEPSFGAAIEPSRRHAVLAAVWAAVRSEIAANPRKVSPDYRLVSMRVRRVH